MAGIIVYYSFRNAATSFYTFSSTPYRSPLPAANASHMHTLVACNAATSFYTFFIYALSFPTPCRKCFSSAHPYCLQVIMKIIAFGFFFNGRRSYFRRYQFDSFFFGFIAELFCYLYDCNGLFQNVRLTTVQACESLAFMSSKLSCSKN